MTFEGGIAVAWWVNILPEVVDGVRSFGFTDPAPDNILVSIESYLARYGEECAQDRWIRCPDDYFVYSHILISGWKYYTLEFVVRDTSKAAGVLEVVWVECFPEPCP
jgi:hypothetical protein